MTDPTDSEQRPDSGPVQQELPDTVDPGQVIVNGQVLQAWPKDLYIPPDALEVFLETFEGPLDLLLYLIRRQNLDILNIPVAEITRQYTGYIELMRAVGRLSREPSPTAGRAGNRCGCVPEPRVRECGRRATENLVGTAAESAMAHVCQNPADRINVQ